MPPPAIPVASPDSATLLIRLLLATALAGVVGWEREQAGRAAGLRTHMLVGLAAALYTALGTLVMGEEHGESGRLIQAVAIGIGFLGGGAISAARTGGHVVGLTTAASIWTTAAVGIATGIGQYLLAAGATLVQLIVLRGLSRFDR